MCYYLNFQFQYQKVNNDRLAEEKCTLLSSILFTHKSMAVINNKKQEQKDYTVHVLDYQ